MACLAPSLGVRESFPSNQVLEEVMVAQRKSGDIQSWNSWFPRGLKMTGLIEHGVLTPRRELRRQESTLPVDRPSVRESKAYIP